MTGREWNTYFKGLENNYKKELLKAFLLIDQDPMIQKNFGRDFLALANFIEYPLSEKPEPTQEQIGQWLKAAYR